MIASGYTSSPLAQTGGIDGRSILPGGPDAAALKTTDPPGHLRHPKAHAQLAASASAVSVGGHDPDVIERGMHLLLVGRCRC
jgi:hypothetical protein